MKKVVEFFQGFGISPAIVLGLTVLLLSVGAFLLMSDLPQRAGSSFFALLPLWAPVVLAFAFWGAWIRYVRAKHIAEQDMVLLEVKIPRDIFKSPVAMEAFFEGINIGIGETTFIDRWIKGKVRPWFSFEIASIEGRIHFYIWTRRFLKEIVSAQLYAAYAEVELYEVDDYTARISYDPEHYEVKAADFVLSDKDPIPIKTYFDYGLDKNPKEEEKVDPISHFYEILSILGPGEQMWIQVLIRQNKDEVTEPGKWFKKTNRWKKEGKDIIEEITKKATPELKDKDGNKIPALPHLSEGQKDKIKAIERSVSKAGLDAGIRGVYIAEKGAFKADRFVGMLGVFKQFSSANLNGLRPTRWHIQFGYPWQDFRNTLQLMTSRQAVDAFRRRSWFHPPYKTPHYVLTSEELATILHYPSRTIVAPGLERVAAKKEEAPPNLPV